VTTRRFLLVLVILSGALGMSLQGASILLVGDNVQLPPTYVPSGKQMYREYCAACHGSDGKGRGPAAPTLSRRPPDLTTLAKRHGGKFPEEYVTSVMRFGPGFSAHGSSEMPVWGPLFQYLENYNEAAVRQRIRNLCEYLESFQER
jgi:mono/diheme cytochrome c family protein